MIVEIPISEDLIRAVSRHFGPTAQLLVAVEEAGEFVQAAAKHVNRGGSEEKLVAETADLLFLVLQVRHILGKDKVDNALLMSQERVLERMKEAKP